MTNPEQAKKLETLKLEDDPLSPERMGLLDRLRIKKSLGRVADVAGGLTTSAVERTRGSVDIVKDFALDSREAVSDGVHDVLERRSDVVESAKKAVEKFQPVIDVGVDVVEAVVEPYGIEHDEKLKIRPFKFGRAALRAYMNPAGAGKRALRTAKKTALTSGVKAITG